MNDYWIDKYILCVLDVADPAQLLQNMREDGLTLKKTVLGRTVNEHDPNQVI